LLLRVVLRVIHVDVKRELASGGSLNLEAVKDVAIRAGAETAKALESNWLACLVAECVEVSALGRGAPNSSLVPTLIGFFCE